MDIISCTGTSIPNRGRSVAPPNLRVHLGIPCRKGGSDPNFSTALKTLSYFAKNRRDLQSSNSCKTPGIAPRQARQNQSFEPWLYRRANGLSCGGLALPRPQYLVFALTVAAPNCALSESRILPFARSDAFKHDAKARLRGVSPSVKNSLDRDRASDNGTIAREGDCKGHHRREKQAGNLYRNPALLIDKN
jgi:hypothetical protein